MAEEFSGIDDAGSDFLGLPGDSGAKDKFEEKLLDPGSLSKDIGRHYRGLLEREAEVISVGDDSAEAPSQDDKS